MSGIAFFLQYFKSLIEMMSADDHQSKRKSSEFITKLMSILEDEQNRRVIKFDQKKYQLIILSISKLEKILPTYFRHCKYSSFSRQLNWFGFKKIRGSAHVYKNSELKKGKKLHELISKRKPRCKKIQQEYMGDREIVGSLEQNKNLMLKNEAENERNTQTAMANWTFPQPPTNFQLVYFPEPQVDNSIVFYTAQPLFYNWL